ncbi:hypothetical protein NY08_2166 [Rhodococcus sp. B7740]|nr:hypothetical protein NY08_2166 [Rhodococcus sp. B7740]
MPRTDSLLAGLATDLISACKSRRTEESRHWSVHRRTASTFVTIDVNSVPCAAGLHNRATNFGSDGPGTALQETMPTPHPKFAPRSSNLPV